MLKHITSILIFALVISYTLTIAELKVAGADIVWSVESGATQTSSINTEIANQQRNKQILVWVFVAILFSWLAACFGRTKSWWLGGVVGFLLGLLIWWISRIWFFMPLFAISGLVYDYLVSRHYKEYQYGKKGSFWCTPSELEQLKRIEELEKSH
jgi:hypothetical protein